MKLAEVIQSLVNVASDVEGDGEGPLNDAINALQAIATKVDEACTIVGDCDGHARTALTILSEV